jgi:hypothetical protein
MNDPATPMPPRPAKLAEATHRIAGTCRLTARRMEIALGTLEQCDRAMATPALVDILSEFYTDLHIEKVKRIY